MYQRTQSQTYHFKTHHQENMICQIIAIVVNPKERNAIQRKSAGNRRNRTRQTHRQAILIRLKTVTIDTRDAKRRSIQKNDPIKLCARLTEIFLTEAYKLKITKFKLDGDPL